MTSKTPLKNIKIPSYCINTLDCSTMLDFNFPEKPYYSKIKNVTISIIILKFKFRLIQTVSNFTLVTIFNSFHNIHVCLSNWTPATSAETYTWKYFTGLSNNTLDDPWEQTVTGLQC